ncbi:MAG: nucleoside hydrolase [Planctomycetaceae bacterium]
MRRIRLSVLSLVCRAGAMFALGISVTGANLAADRPIPIILDTDIGTDVDDAYALVLAARSPQLDLRAVTTVHGKVDVRSKIARKLLDQVGRHDVPVATGLSVGQFWGGWEGQGVLDPDEQVPAISEKPAFELMHDILTKSAEKVVIVPVGGVSNVAELVRRYPEDKSRIERLVMMGGCFRPLVINGKEFPERSEVNLHNDVAAAAYVLRAGLPMTFMPAEVSYHTKLYESDFDRIRQAGTPLAKSITAMTDAWSPKMKKFLEQLGTGDYYKDNVAMLHDPGAVFMLTNPSAVKVERMRIRVESDDKSIRTVVDPNGPIEVDVAVDVDREALSKACTDAVLK